jgi:hypothetical protein
MRVRADCRMGTINGTGRRAGLLNRRSKGVVVRAILCQRESLEADAGIQQADEGR